MSEAFELDGKVVLITGASRGVGAATAVEAAARGARVACVSRSTDAAPKRIPGTIDQTVNAIAEAGREALTIPADLTSPADIKRMINSTLARWGRPSQQARQRPPGRRCARQPPEF